jgi:hypothetical protein
MSTEMWISECENICSFLSHKKELLNFFYDNIKNENLILEKMKGYNTYLDEKSLLLGIKLSLKEIKRVQLSLTANRS